MIRTVNETNGRTRFLFADGLDTSDDIVGVILNFQSTYPELGPKDVVVVTENASEQPLPFYMYYCLKRRDGAQWTLYVDRDWDICSDETLEFSYVLAMLSAQFFEAGMLVKSDISTELTICGLSFMDDDVDELMIALVSILTGRSYKLEWE